MAPPIFRLILFSASIGMLLLIPATSLAQNPATDFKELRLKISAGDTIYVTDQSGRELSADVLDVSDATLGVRISGERRNINEADVLRIRQRQRDSLWNGALIGLGVGIGSGALLAQFSDDCSYSGGSACVGPALQLGAGCAAVGAGIDALIRGRRVIYQRPSSGVSRRVTVAPTFSASVNAIVLTWGF